MRNKILALLASSFILSACATTHWQSGLQTETPPIKKEVWSHSFLFGIISADEAQNLNELCDNNEFQVLQTRSNFIQVIISLGTLGIYTPYSVGAVCKTK